MPIVGDDAQAVGVASRLIRELGYEPVLIGGLAMAEILDVGDGAGGGANGGGDTHDCGDAQLGSRAAPA